MNSHVERLTDGGFIRVEPGRNGGIHLAGRDDDTPVYNGQPDRTRCGFCYAGPAHSERRHEQSVGAK